MEDAGDKNKHGNKTSKSRLSQFMTSIFPNNFFQKKNEQKPAEETPMSASSTPHATPTHQVDRMRHEEQTLEMTYSFLSSLRRDNLGDSEDTPMSVSTTPQSTPTHRAHASRARYNEEALEMLQLHPCVSVLKKDKLEDSEDTPMSVSSTPQTTPTHNATQRTDSKDEKKLKKNFGVHWKKKILQSVYVPFLNKPTTTDSELNTSSSSSSSTVKQDIEKLQKPVCTSNTHHMQQSDSMAVDINWIKSQIHIYSELFGIQPVPSGASTSSSSSTGQDVEPPRFLGGQKRNAFLWDLINKPEETNEQQDDKLPSDNILFHLKAMLKYKLVYGSEVEMKMRDFSELYEHLKLDANVTGDYRLAIYTQFFLMKYYYKHNSDSWTQQKKDQFINDLSKFRENPSYYYTILNWKEIFGDTPCILTMYQNSRDRFQSSTPTIYSSTMSREEVSGEVTTEQSTTMSVLNQQHSPCTISGEQSQSTMPNIDVVTDTTTHNQSDIFSNLNMLANQASTHASVAEGTAEHDSLPASSPTERQYTINLSEQDLEDEVLSVTVSDVQDASPSTSV